MLSSTGSSSQKPLHLLWAESHCFRASCPVHPHRSTRTVRLDLPPLSYVFKNTVDAPSGPSPHEFFPTRTSCHSLRPTRTTRQRVCRVAHPALAQGTHPGHPVHKAPGGVGDINGTEFHDSTHHNRLRLALSNTLTGVLKILCVLHSFSLPFGGLKCHPACRDGIGSAQLAPTS